MFKKSSTPTSESETKTSLASVAEGTRREVMLSVVYGIVVIIAALALALN